MVLSGWKKTKLGSLCTLITSSSRDWAKYYRYEVDKPLGRFG
jgi:hypothetical protein